MVLFDWLSSLRLYGRVRGRLRARPARRTDKPFVPVTVETLEPRSAPSDSMFMLLAAPWESIRSMAKSAISASQDAQAKSRTQPGARTGSTARASLPAADETAIDGKPRPTSSAVGRSSAGSRDSASGRESVLATPGRFGLPESALQEHAGMDDGRVPPAMARRPIQDDADGASARAGSAGGGNSFEPNGSPVPAPSVGRAEPDAGSAATTGFGGFVMSSHIIRASESSGGGSGSGASGGGSSSPNNNPWAMPDSASVQAGGAQISINVLGNDYDPDGDPLLITNVGQGTRGVAGIGPSGNVVYQPYSNPTPGTDEFSYTISDGRGGMATATVTVTITAQSGPSGSGSGGWSGTGGSQNHSPVAGNDVISVTGTSGSTYPLANDSDPDSDALTLVSYSQATLGTVSMAMGGHLVFTVHPGVTSGQDSFTYTISDGHGGTATATVSVTIQGGSGASGSGSGMNNHAPTAVADSATSGPSGTVIPVLMNDSDSDGDSLTITSFTQGMYGAVSQSTPGQLTYSPMGWIYPGTTDSFTYTISDGHGGTATATVSVTIQGGSGASGSGSGMNNHAPTAVADSATSGPPGTVIPVLMNDSDPDGDSLTITSLTQGMYGAVTQSSPGQLTYTPIGPTMPGMVDSFTYTISDGHGGAATATVSVTIQGGSGASGSGSGMNHAPTATADQATAGFTATAIPVLSNDTDPDGDSLTITGFTQGMYGAVSQSPAGQLTYTPMSGASPGMTDSFTYSISDGHGGTATATVTIAFPTGGAGGNGGGSSGGGTGGGSNHNPVANNDEYTINVAEQRTLDIAPGQNDVDADGDPLQISFSQVPVDLQRQGTFAPLFGNSWRFTFAPYAQGGTWTIPYSVSDNRGGFASAIIRITAYRQAGESQANADTIVVRNHDFTPKYIDVLTNDVYPEGTNPHITSFTNGTWGVVNLTPSGQLQYSPSLQISSRTTAGSLPPDSFTYTTTDAFGTTRTGTVHVQFLLTPTPNPPADSQADAPTPWHAALVQELPAVAVTDFVNLRNWSPTAVGDLLVAVVPRSWFLGNDQSPYGRALSVVDLAVPQNGAPIPTLESAETAGVSLTSSGDVRVAWQKGQAPNYEIAYTVGDGQHISEPGRIHFEWNNTPIYIGTSSASEYAIQNWPGSNITSLPMMISPPFVDPDGDPLQYEFSGPVMPAYYTPPEGHTVLYGVDIPVPSGDWLGTVVFQVRAKDPYSTEWTEWHEVRVNVITDYISYYQSHPSLIASDDLITWDGDGSLPETINVLTNDYGGTVATPGVYETLHGTFDLLANGQVTYSPTTPGGIVSDKLTYSLTNAQGETRDATIYVQPAILPPGSSTIRTIPPVLAADGFTVIEPGRTLRVDSGRTWNGVYWDVSQVGFGDSVVWWEGNTLHAYAVNQTSGQVGARGRSLERGDIRLVEIRDASSVEPVDIVWHGVSGAEKNNPGVTASLITSGDVSIEGHTSVLSVTAGGDVTGATRAGYAWSTASTGDL